tara:strand:- start:1923 stop:2186 length:264 start_codon:yes stop_codon:yes gene_type:complete
MYANVVPFKRPTKNEAIGPQKVQFKPEAIDGDGDGFVQDGTEFERPIEELAVNPKKKVRKAAESVEVEPSSEVDDSLHIDDTMDSEV